LFLPIKLLLYGELLFPSSDAYTFNGEASTVVITTLPELPLTRREVVINWSLLSDFLGVTGGLGLEDDDPALPDDSFSVLSKIFSLLLRLAIETKIIYV
jgi:hypothetical protein